MTTPRVTVPVEPEGGSPFYSAAYDSIRKGAPGLSDATCAVIARSINMKVALLSAAPAPEGGAVRYRHKKRGTEYTLIGVGRAQGELQDDDPVVLYRGDDGGLWVRHQVEFCDGRFEQVSALATRSDDKPEGGAVMKACADFQEAIDNFEAEVADVMAEGSERADLWDREIMVNIDALKTVMNAALATREEAPAEAGDRSATPLADELEDMARCMDKSDGAIPCLLASAKMLRAQPQAREDAQPVASAYRVRPEMNDPEEWTLMHPERAFDYLDRPGWETQPLYTHPAPDALRVAVEAIRAEINAPLTGPTHGAWDRGRIAGLKEALAALQAEQGAK